MGIVAVCRRRRVEDGEHFLDQGPAVDGGVDGQPWAVVADGDRPVVPYIHREAGCRPCEDKVHAVGNHLEHQIHDAGGALEEVHPGALADRLDQIHGGSLP